jgi:hypothetical protein
MFANLDAQAFDVVKSQMQNEIRDIKSKLKDLKKREQKGMRVSCTEIDKLENLQRIYSSKYVLPVKFEGLIINYKLLSDFLKKIKNYNLKGSVIDGALTIEYMKEKGMKGQLQLNDISHYYQYFQGIPAMSLEYGEIAYGA